MNRKTRLPKGQNVKKKTRLKSDKSRHEVVDLVRKVPNDRLFKYAGISKKDALVNPALGTIKEEAIKEIGRRKMLQKSWAKGKAPPKLEGESVLHKIVHFGRKGAHLLGRGVQEYFKVISGEKARELEEWIETIGMSEEEKKKFHEARQKHLAEEREEERAELAKISPLLAEPEKVPPKEPKPAPPVPSPPPVEKPPVEEKKPPAKGTVINIYTGEAPAKKEPEPPTPEEELVHLEEERPVREEDIELGNVFEIIDEERAELAREMERPYDERESLGDIIAEGQQQMAEEQGLVERDKARVQGRRKK